MRKLHLVGVTSDLKGLIFSGRRGSTSGGYLVNIEDELIDAIADARRVSDPEEMAPGRPALGAGGDGARKRTPRPDSTLTPREIQARLRAGRSIAEVAAEAQVDTEWVERFAVPILAEQARIVAQARSLKFSKPRLGESSAPLGKSVALNLADRGVIMQPDAFEAAWSAYQLHDSIWVVRFRYRSRGRVQEASWELDTESGMAGHRNRLGSELGFVEPTRRRKTKGPSVSGERGAGQEPGGAAEDGGPGPAPARPAAKKGTGRAASKAAGAASTRKRNNTVRSGRPAKATPKPATRRKRASSPKKATTPSAARGKANANATRVPSTQRPLIAAQPVSQLIRRPAPAG